eukprot:50857-Chlamydomonas_euryale.AAC.1
MRRRAAKGVAVAVVAAAAQGAAPIRVTPSRAHLAHAHHAAAAVNAVAAVGTTTPPSPAAGPLRRPAWAAAAARPPSHAVHRAVIGSGLQNGPRQGSRRSSRGRRGGGSCR